MSEIPEHLLKRAQEARERVQGSDEGAATATEEKAESKIPEHLLERSVAAKSKGPGAAAAASLRGRRRPPSAGRRASMWP